MIRSKQLRVVRPRARDITEAMAWLREKGGHDGTAPDRLRAVADGLMRLRMAVDAKLVRP